jgi:hypothetical protein
MDQSGSPQKIVEKFVPLMGIKKIRKIPLPEEVADILASADLLMEKQKE